MTMVFEQILTPGIAQLSYLIGDDSSGTAAVIDPRPDCDVYLELARERNVGITHIFETHIHADFLSGSRELADRTGIGANAIFTSDEGGAEYGFDRRGIRDGDVFEFGSALLKVRHTPGHTPEHVAYELREKDGPKEPWGVVTGDSLFVGSAGRPDLLGEEQAEELTEQLFRTLREYFLRLDDGVTIYPCHGAGSACGADIGDRPVSSIGWERRQNEFLQKGDLASFKKFVKETSPPEPSHYRRLKRTNGRGPEILGRLPATPGLSSQAFHAAVERGSATLLDTRQMLAFGGGHIAGAINIGAREELSTWAGQMLDPERPILLVVEHERMLPWVVRQLLHVGLTRFEGYLVGGMKSWEVAGYPFVKLPQISVHELHDRQDEFQILDVRAPSEWESGHVPGARHAFVAEMRDGLDGTGDLDRRKPVATYCGSGYRANIAASLLRRAGFEDVRNVPGSWSAWRKSGYPVEK